MNYHSPRTDPHIYEEELQWARVLAQGDPRKGMILVLVQKMCTAFHEFEPAWREGILPANQVSFLKQRIIARMDHVITTAEANEFGEASGITELREQRDKIRSVDTAEELFAMTERIHEITHHISEGLEKE